MINFAIALYHSLFRESRFLKNIVEIRALRRYIPDKRPADGDYTFFNEKFVTH